MPQRIADSDDVGPRRLGITRPKFCGESPRRLGNNLDRAVGGPAKAVAVLVNLEIQAAKLQVKVSDFIADMEQAHAHILAGGHQNIRTASRSASGRMYGDSASRVE